MMWMKKLSGIGLFVCLLIGFSAGYACAQEAQLSLDIQVNEALANSQSIDVKSLVSNTGSGPTLFQIYLTNRNPNEYANNLYLEVIIRSDKVGTIADATQIDGQPFSLSPGQQIYATNNSISKGLPGVEEVIQFDGGLTQAGKDFVSNLQGNLPADRYSVEINVFQGGRQENKVASASAEVGTHIVEDINNFYLLSPGDEVGSHSLISNSYPNFQWQGQAGTTYRLLVVEGKENDSPQSLLDGAENTPPIRKNGISAGGSLVDYEMLDAVVDGSSYQYPSSGVQNLEPGKTYYWRVIRQLNTGDGVNTKKSEIWSFSLPQQQKSVVTTQDNGDFKKALKSVLGNKFEKFAQDGYSFQSIQIDGQTYQGGQALQKLLELSRRVEQGDVSIIIEEQ